MFSSSLSSPSTFGCAGGDTALSATGTLLDSVCAFFAGLSRKLVIFCTDDAVAVVVASFFATEVGAVESALRFTAVGAGTGACGARAASWATAPMAATATEVSVTGTVAATAGTAGSVVFTVSAGAVAGALTLVAAAALGARGFRGFVSFASLWALPFPVADAEGPAVVCSTTSAVGTTGLAAFFSAAVIVDPTAIVAAAGAAGPLPADGNAGACSPSWFFSSSRLEAISVVVARFLAGLLFCGVKMIASSSSGCRQA